MHLPRRQIYAPVSGMAVTNSVCCLLCFEDVLVVDVMVPGYFYRMLGVLVRFGRVSPAQPCSMEGFQLSQAVVQDPGIGVCTFGGRDFCG